MNGSTSETKWFDEQIIINNPFGDLSIYLSTNDAIKYGLIDSSSVYLSLMNLNNTCIV